MKKQEKTALKEIITPKMLMCVFALSLLFSCGGSDAPPIDTKDTTKPTATINSVTVKDLDGDGKQNDAEISVTATDNVAIRATEVAVGSMPAAKVGSKYIVSDLAGGNHSAKVDVTDTSGNSSSAVKSFTVAMENVAPDMVVEFDNFLENQAIGTVVGTVTVSDANGDNLTTTLTEGTDDFELALQNGQTNTYNIKTKKVFDYETANNGGYDIKTKVIDQELFKEIAANAEVLDGDDGPETFTQADIVVQRNIHTGNYTFNPTMLRDGVAAITKTDKADNDKNTENWVYEIVNSTDGNERIDLATVEAEIQATGRGDATSLNLAPGIVDGYGIAGFRLTTDAEFDANDESVLVNEHGEFVSGPGFDKVIQFFKEKFGLTGSVNFKNPPFGDRNLQNARACVVMHTMFMTQTGADEAETVQKWGAKTYQYITNLTNTELENFMKITHPNWYFEVNGGWHAN